MPQGKKATKKKKGLKPRKGLTLKRLASKAAADKKQGSY